MLQSEFFERTKVNLSGEEYAKVEDIYNSVKMDKDEFCKLWLKNKDNKIISELMETISSYRQQCEDLMENIRSLKSNLEDKTAEMDEQLASMDEAYKSHLREFGAKMVVNFEDDITRYDNICEEFGLGFICTVKLENDLELEKAEREYILKKLA